MSIQFNISDQFYILTNLSTAQTSNLHYLSVEFENPVRENCLGHSTGSQASLCLLASAELSMVLAREAISELRILLAL